MKTCAVFGASGHGKVIAEIAELNDYSQIEFFDDRWPKIRSLQAWPVVGDSSILKKRVKEFDALVIAIGNNTIRLSKQLLFETAGANIVALIHPRATISQYSIIHPGTVVMANAVVNPFSRIGKGCIINTNATIEHDCALEDGVHISPNASLAGGVKVGKHSWVGIGSQVKQMIMIGNNVVVGAGSTVIKNIPDFEIVIGSPAKPLTKSE